MNTVINVEQCWCGSKGLRFFSEHYLLCKECNTLICGTRANEEFYSVADDSGFYGKDYWTKYVTEGLGLPDIVARSRNDLAERCIYWIRTILKYKLPPATTLELGCAHGGLVYLMKLAGYNSTGAEVSRWICDFAGRTFDIPMLCGRIEDLAISPKTYDMIILMDVLEHFPDPVGSIRKIAECIKDDGVIVIQTPCWRETGKTYEEMKADQSIFMSMFQEKEHLHLFNEGSLRRLLEGAGFRHIEFEPHIFPYDMFVFAGKQLLKTADKETVAAELLNKPGSRAVAALVDVFETLELSEADRKARFDQIQELNSRIQKLNSHLALRLGRKIYHIYRNISGKGNPG